MAQFPYIKIKDYINGQWHEEKDCKVTPLYNPSTGEQIGEVPHASTQAIEEATATAHETYMKWKNVPVAKRMVYLHDMRAGMIRNFEKLAIGIAYDQAKHISEARGEVQRVIELLEMACAIPSLIQGDTLDQIGTTITGRVVKQSLGVFGGVAPFNFPALVFGWFIPFAIGVGNTFVYKPSTQSPYFMQLMCEIFSDIGLPPGVVNVIHGSRAIPESWYKDPRISGVCLVGSTPTAKKMAAGCAEGAKRSMLLGGAKNMLVVMEDADMDIFIRNFLNSCYGSAGQRCLAGSIVAVTSERYDEALERMIEASKKIVVGDAFGENVYMGPLISRAAADNVINFVDTALNHGKCELVLDGRRPALPEKNKNGYFVGPTIIKDVTPCNPLFTTEVFGPLVATIKITGVDDALALIRASEFGNGACIFTQNLHYAETFSREADVGMVGVNVGICAPHPFLPFGGIKGSLIGTNKVQGLSGIDFFTQDKVITVFTHDPNAIEEGADQKPKSVRSCVAS